VELSFNQQFDQYGAWCKTLALRLHSLGEWLEGHELIDDAGRERLQQLESQLRHGKVMVAFVAEFSRGKSELINAVFFAGYGQRIMPATAGRTTMCPTELGYDADLPACLRLLPIESRLQPQTLLEWRQVPEQWTRIDLDVNDAKRLASAMEKVAETRWVSQDEARALGFWHDEQPDENPIPDAQGRVEVPRWRHALINMAHPLLKQGLVVLDTPGLNAIGAEPELTVSLIPQAQAVVFILGADAGVSRSDLSIWREHLLPEDGDPASRLVVLNKIDTLWDALSTPAQVQAQIERQRVVSAEILGVPPGQVIPVSAQKGLLAKVRGDAGLLRDSGLPGLEDALGDGLLRRRQHILGSAVAAGTQRLRKEAERVLRTRRRELAEQVVELKGLRGKNASVIRQMRQRIEQEQTEFDSSAVRLHALRSVHMKRLAEVVELLGSSTLRTELGELHAALRQTGIKFGIQKIYGQTFERLNAIIDKVQATNADIEVMLGEASRQINAEYGFALQVPEAPDLTVFANDLKMVQSSHLRYMSMGSLFKLAQSDFSARLARTLIGRVRSIFEAVLGEVELWNKAFSAQLDLHLRERRRNFTRRIEAVDRIHQAASGLDVRLSELQAQEEVWTEVETALHAITDPLIQAPQDAPDGVAIAA